MTLYTRLLWAVACWTLVEGILLMTAPGVSVRLTRMVFRSLSRFLEDIPSRELRKMGAVEFTFGFLLLLYLVWI